MRARGLFALIRNVFFLLPRFGFLLALIISPSSLLAFASALLTVSQQKDNFVGFFLLFLKYVKRNYNISELLRMDKCIFQNIILQKLWFNINLMCYAHKRKSRPPVCLFQRRVNCSTVRSIFPLFFLIWVILGNREEILEHLHLLPKKRDFRVTHQAPVNIVIIFMHDGS